MNFGGTLRVNKFMCLIFALLVFLIIYWRSAGTTGFVNANKDELVNLKSLLKAAIQSAERGGRKVIDGTNHALNVKSKGKTQEGANDPVTDADYASHCAMYYSLINTFPTLNVVSEEHSKGEGSCSDQPMLDTVKVLPDHHSIEMLNDEHVLGMDVTIWIDPLDATQEYTEGLYQYVTTMVCVAIRGVPVIGVIHYPFPPRTYWGWFTKETSYNMPKGSPKQHNKEQSRVVVSRSHPGKGSDIAKQAFGPNTIVTPAAGAGYKIMEVLNGTFDIYLHATAIKKWDLCAGDAIIKTVGGKLTNTKGEYIEYLPNGKDKVTGGFLATRYDHDYYLTKLSEKDIH